MEFFQSNLHLGEILVQIIAFLIVFFTLRALAWKKILGLLENRRTQIKNEFEKIDATKKEVETLRAEYNTHLKRIDEEARQKLQEAIGEGKRVSQEIQNEARKAAQEILEKAKEDIQLEVAKARITLRDEIVDLTLSATEHMLEKKVDTKQDEELVLQFIKKLESEK